MTPLPGEEPERERQRVPRATRSYITRPAGQLDPKVKAMGVGGIVAWAIVTGVAAQLDVVLHPGVLVGLTAGLVGLAEAGAAYAKRSWFDGSATVTEEPE